MPCCVTATAATIHLLAANGKLKLDDDIRTRLPQLPALSKTPVTIRHLLHHTGGLRDYTALMILGGRQIADIATSGDARGARAPARQSVRARREVGVLEHRLLPARPDRRARRNRWPSKCASGSSSLSR